MTYYGSKELAASFRTVRANTIKIAEEIPEDKYDFRPTPESRSVAQTLVHVAVSVRIQQGVHFNGEPLATLVGLDFFGLMGAIIAEEQKPRTKAEIIELLKTEGEKYATQLEGCTEELLGQSVQYPEGMMPPTKSRFEMVMAPKEHEMHHRGQLMLVERMLGVTPHLTRQMQERVAAMAAAQKA
jgi:uncharacterized damage-inducible protein DinB